MTGSSKQAHGLFQSDWEKLLLIVLLTFIAYSSAVHGGFIWDDNDYVTENPLLTAPDGLWRIWTTAETRQYYPLVFTTFWVERHLWGLHPAGFHIVNIILHAINAVLVWRLLRRLRIPGAWMIGAVFAVHPVEVESVAWVTERKNVMSGMFYLLAMASYLRFEDERRWSWYGGSLLLFVMALLSKTVTASLPAALLLIRWYQGRRIGRKEIALLVPFFVIGMGLGLTTAWLEVNRVGAEGQIFDLSILQKLMLAGRVLVFYAEKLIWPVNLIFNYPRWELDIRDWAQWGWLIGAGIAVLMVWVMREKWGRGPAAALGFFIVTLGPVLGFLKVYPFYYSYVADHFQYLASLGPITLVVGGGVWWMERERWPERYGGFLPSSVAVVVLLLLGLLTWRQGLIYKDNTTLYLDTLRKNPDSFLAHKNLGIILSLNGELDEAVVHFRESVRIKPNDDSAHNNLGYALQSLGRIREAIPHYIRAIEINPKLVVAHYHLGLALQLQGKPDEAIQEYIRALEIDPNDMPSHYQLGQALIMTGQPEKALFQFREALRLNPNASAPMNAAAWIFATQSDPSLRNADLAVRLAERAVELSRRQNPRYLDTLAAAYASAGSFEQAVAAALEGISLASASPRDKLADRIRMRLELYRQGKPYREPAQQYSQRPTAGDSEEQ